MNLYWGRDSWIRFGPKSCWLGIDSSTFISAHIRTALVFQCSSAEFLRRLPCRSLSVNCHSLTVKLSGRCLWNRCALEAARQRALTSGTRLGVRGEPRRRPVHRQAYSTLVLAPILAASVRGGHRPGPPTCGGRGLPSSVAPPSVFWPPGSNDALFSPWHSSPAAVQRVISPLPSIAACGLGRHTRQKREAAVPEYTVALSRS